MNTPWTYLHRLTVSLMLVAVLAFVLQGTVSEHLPTQASAPECMALHQVHLAHAAHGATAHHHTHSGIHSHPVNLPLDAHEEDRSAHQTEAEGHKSHCTSVISVAALLPSPGSVSPLLIVHPVAHELLHQHGSGTAPHGLKRPPRTASIA